MSTTKKIFTNLRIWIYIIFFALTLLAINPSPFNKGVAIRSVLQNSSAYDAGIPSPDANIMPTARERIVAINNVDVKSVSDFENIISTIPTNTTVSMQTEVSKGFFITQKNRYFLNYMSEDKLGLKVYPAPTSNIRLGLDLQGGTRVVLQPEEELDKQKMDDLISNMKERMNVFGLSDIVIRSTTDLSGGQFIIVEIAGVNEEEVKDLLSRQGKFEAKIGNETVFLGGKDITYVCRTSECSGLDPRVGCVKVTDGQLCRFYFQISLTQDAADRQANITSKLDVVRDPTAGASDEGYLSQKLDLYLDDSLRDSLNIGAGLKGKAETSIVISGSGTGRTREEALAAMNSDMRRLQTILQTGSLPVKLKIIKTDTLSPTLGKEFLQNAMWIGILAELAVTFIVILRYKKIKIAIPIITVITSEILLILGLAAFTRQNIDIAGIAGIIVAIGTGVDDQIVITDEILGHKEEEDDKFLTWSQRMKRAFFIVIASYFATIASMIPLMNAGAELLKGFAITTIIGVTNGVLITRPAFAEMMRIILKED